MVWKSKGEKKINHSELLILTNWSLVKLINPCLEGSGIKSHEGFNKPKFKVRMCWGFFRLEQLFIMDLNSLKLNWKTLKVFYNLTIIKLLNHVYYCLDRKILFIYFLIPPLQVWKINVKVFLFFEFCSI